MATIRLCVNRDGSVSTNGHESFRSALNADAKLTWIDVPRIETDIIRELGSHYGFHDLSVEDAQRGGQRPKLETFDDEAMFLVFYTITMVDQRVVTNEVHFFLGESFIVTVHTDPVPAFDDVAKRWNTLRQARTEHTKGLLLYALLDGIVDEYFPALDAIGEQLEDLESRAFDANERESRKQVFAMRKELLQLRRIVSAERDVVNGFLRHDVPTLSHDVIVYMSDVYDHLMRCFDWIESYRDQLATLLDLQSAAAANRMNQIMKTLTASSIILMTASLVAGIYGMNFTHMPELDWRYGYAYALVLMLGLMTGIYVIFRRRDWF